MLAHIKQLASDIFLGEPVAETEEIYRSHDGKFRLHLGLFRKGDAETVWLRFVRKAFPNYSSDGFGFGVVSFQSFADFLNAAHEKSLSDSGKPIRVPFFTGLITRITEGIAGANKVGVYRGGEGDDREYIRLIAFTNRRQQRRVIFDHRAPGHETLQVFDLDVLSVLGREIESRQTHQTPLD